MRVLLVEDDVMIGDAVEQALREAHYAVDWVRDGAVAMLTLRSQDYDIVLLDLGLPGTDGAAVLRSLRARDNPVPVLVITARDAVDERIDRLDDGADDFLVKPFELGELLARMRAVMPQGRHGRAGVDQRKKNCLRSGKNNSKRSRFVTCLSTSTCEKSGFTVRSKLSDEVIAILASPPKSAPFFTASPFWKSRETLPAAKGIIEIFAPGFFGALSQIISPV